MYNKNQEERWSMKDKKNDEKRRKQRKDEV